jgi:uncharacterized protein (TIGR03545 family)
MRYIRWKALLPLSVVLIGIALWTWLFMNPTAKWAVERGGTAAVGAKVDLAEADVRIRDGAVRLRGLEVTNPAKPMENLIEIGELSLDVVILPALERKVIVDSAIARDIRFNTPRRTSGAIPKKEKEAEETSTLIEDFKRQIKVPPIALSTLTQSVNVEAISPESLATLAAARHARAYADTARDKLLADLRAADPRPAIDSAEALAQRLATANLRTLGITGARQAVADVRRTLRALEQIDDRLRGFELETRGNAAGLQARLEAIPAARTQDYAYARGLLRLPSFDVPSVGPQLFSDFIAERLASVLYWAELAQRYIPPGLERQLNPGPKRVRASGTTVLFPKERVLPDFLMRLAEISLTLGGEGASAGRYNARLTGVTNQPAVFGAPTTFTLHRSDASVGPTDIRIAGLLDHRTAISRDTLGARLAGIALPSFPLGGLGGQVVLGQGLSALQLERRGDSLSGRWLWRAPNVRWARDSIPAAAVNARTQGIEDVLWRAMARIDSVEIEARIGGTMRQPTLGVRTNVANAVGEALRAQLGDEIRRAEQQVRARVDALVDERVAEARAYADQARGQVAARVADERARLETQKQALEARLRDLVRIPGIG